MRIALKFSLVLLLGIMIVLGGVTLFEVRREADLFESDSAHDNALMGTWLAVAAEEAARKGGPEAADRFILLADEKSSSVRIRRVASTPQANDLRPVALAAGGGGLFRVDRDAQPSGEIYTYVHLSSGLGELEVAESLASERKYIRTTELRHLAAAGVMTGICAVMVLALGLKLVGRPVERLVTMTRRVGGGDLSLRLMSRGRDELSQLAREIDRMVDHLEQSRSKLEAEIAARIETIEQLRRADRLATVGKLASGIAHELGTPLNVIAARAKMIATGEVVNGEARDSANVVMEQSGRMSRIIRQLLDVARPRRPDRALMDLQKLVQQAVSLLAPMGSQRGMSLEAVRGAEPIAAGVDSGQIQQVLSNLIINAFQAGRQGGRVTLEVGARQVRPPVETKLSEGAYAVITVRDDGSGISEQNFLHIFEPFFTTKDVGEGTGLGLTVADGIVREHGGWIGVTSRPGHTQFEVFLPRGVP